MRFASTLLFLSLLAPVSCAGTSPAAADGSRCTSLRDHAVELALEASLRPGADDALVAAHRAQLRAALDDDYRGQCATLSDVQLGCQLAAGTLDALGACARGAGGGR